MNDRNLRHRQSPQTLAIIGFHKVGNFSWWPLLLIFAVAFIAALVCIRHTQNACGTTSVQ
jgi:hypothetical protein